MSLALRMVEDEYRLVGYPTRSLPAYRHFTADVGVGRAQPTIES